MEQFKVNDATGEVYEFSAEADAYVFIGNLNGRTEKEFFEEREARESQPY